MEERMSGSCTTKAGRGGSSGNNYASGTRCGRWNPTIEQVKLLTDLFRSGVRTPSTDEIQNISTRLSFYGKIESKNVFYWFQNHKARERQKRRRVSVDEKDVNEREQAIETLQLFPLKSFDEVESEKFRLQANECNEAAAAFSYKFGTEMDRPQLDLREENKKQNQLYITCENKRFPSEQASSSRRRVVQFLGKKLRMDVIKTQQISAKPIEKVIVHPLVLLSIVDNYNRVAKDTRKRVVGVLLGSSFKGTVDVTNSYAVPFEEDDKDPSIWFLDHNYHESMFSMFKRINAKEHVVGWYSTGPKLRENDLKIHGLFNDYVPNPVLVIIDVQPEELGIPTKAYYAVEEVKENATQKSQKVFVHVPSEIAAHDVEEIGVEHLLRDVKDTTISTLATEVTGKLAALKGLDARLKEIRGYLDLVIEGKLPLNHEILYHLQDVFNLLPNLNVADLIKAFAVKTNDMMLVIYLSSLIRSVIALHNLISNKMLNKEHEKAEDSKPIVVPSVAGS
ncbi:hypothetical protein NC652_020665 [Populus alba x Populus x berolinensis]|nr:hypothetical protein NC652_020665 [Populus alba x Populus x berolinensis]